MDTQPDPFFGKSHQVFEKDVFRVMKDEHILDKSNLIPKPAGVTPLVEYASQKYKPRSQLIMEQYQNPVVTEDQLYLIDKVARKRAKDGRFGVDHSEILIYELE